MVNRELNELISAGVLRPLAEAREWIMPRNEAAPNPSPGYVVSFIHFHERGVGAPAHDFFPAPLHHYGAELQHLNPNGIQHISAFVTLCEGFLGIEPHFLLWCHFFMATLQ